MLNVLQHKPVNNVMVIVIRYFGGIKLGAGGLVRAYSQAVEQAYGKAELLPIVVKDRFKIILPFAEENWLRHTLTKFSGEINSTDYQQQVIAEVSLPQEHAQAFIEALSNRQIEFKQNE